MPPQIPSPIISGGSGGRRDPLESILMGLASSAPSILFNILDRRAQGQQQQLQGESTLAAMQGLVEGGQFSNPGVLAALRAAGGQVTPGQSVGPVSLPQQPGGVPGAQAQIPGASTQARADLSGIDPRAAPSLLQTLLGAQQGVAQIEGQQAQTAAIRGQEEREAELQPGKLELQELEADLRRTQISGEKFANSFRKTMAPLEEELVRVQTAEAREGIATSQESRRVGRARLNLDAADLASSIYSDQMSRYTSLAGLYGQLMGDPSAARARAAADVFGDTQPPSRQEYTTSILGGISNTIMTGADASPGELAQSIFSSAVGPDPALQYGQSIGLAPERVEFLNTELAQDKDAAEILEGRRQRLLSQIEGDSPTPQEEAEIAEMLGQTALYLTFKTGQKVPIPPEVKKNKGLLRSILETAGQGLFEMHMGDFSRLRDAAGGLR